MTDGITAADYITRINEAVEKNRINKAAAKILLRDMSDILDKINEGNEQITRIDIYTRNNVFAFEINKYKRAYFNDTGSIETEEWRARGGFHRDDNKPAFMKYYGNGQLRVQVFFNRGVYHRSGDKPAEMVYARSGNVIAEEWWVHGVRHRDNNKPALIEYHEGKIVTSERYNKGVLVVE